MTMQLSVCVTISLATGPYKTATPFNLGVQVSTPLCRVYLGPSSSLQINPGAFASVSAPWWSLGFEIRCITVFRGTWVAQLVKHPALDFGSGHDLMVGEIEP